MPHEQRALEYLVSLGARIEADFTEAELRTAFRMLAREYHPDRHPGSSEQQKDRLTALFRRLRQAYEHLQGAAA
jgi:DnaJ-class molecular chaperone